MAVLPVSGFGQRVRRRLHDETVIIYVATDAKRLDRFAIRPRVALDFDSNGRGGDIVVLTGVAEQALDVPQVDANEAYLAKYGDSIDRMNMDPAQFPQVFSVPIRVRVSRLRGH